MNVPLGVAKIVRFIIKIIIKRYIQFIIQVRMGEWEFYINGWEFIEIGEVREVVIKGLVSNWKIRYGEFYWRGR